MTMQYVLHRVNTKQDLERVKPVWGCELDIRSDVSTRSLHVIHDPFKRGEDFEEWLTEFRRREIQGPLILNTKEDGLEETIIKTVEKHGIQNYFFIDTQLPTLNRLVNQGVQNLSLRFSRIEGSEHFNTFAGKVKWLWVDCFDRIPLPVDLVTPWAKKFQLCLVSPDLQGGTAADFPRFKELAAHCHAICTKSPNDWRAIL